MDSDEGLVPRRGTGPQGDEPTISIYTHPRVLALRGTPAPFFVVHDPRNDTFLAELSQALSESTVVDPSNAGPNVCVLSIGANFEIKLEELTKGTKVEGSVVRQIEELALYYARKIHTQCASLPSPQWHMVVEAEYMENRSTTKDTLHRDDYVRPQHRTGNGGVAFVVLQYFNPDPLFGPELIVDIGPDGGFGEVTLPQLVSLPRDLLQAVSASQRGEFQRRKAQRVIRVHCPKVPAWGGVCFCDPMVFHMSPTGFGPARTDPGGLLGPGGMEGTKTGHKNKLLYWADHPSVKARSGAWPVVTGLPGGPGLLPVPVSVVHGDLPLSRQLDEGGARTSETGRNTFERTRSFIRLTFRARPAT